MNQTNKIIQKRLMPKTLYVGALSFILMLPAAYIATKEIKEPSGDISSIAIMSLAMILTMALLYTPLIEAYNRHYKHASNIVRRYIESEMVQHPELKTFEKILTNPSAMKAVATAVFNSLTESEQKRVLNTIDNLTRYNYATKVDAVNAMKGARDTIIGIIRDHAATHPEFIQEILIVMARADSMYVIQNQQKTR